MLEGKQPELFELNQYWADYAEPGSVFPRPPTPMADNDEGVALLPPESELSRFQRKPNPLPWPQLSVVLFVRACDALMTESIQPYINEVRTTCPRGAQIWLDLLVSAARWWDGHHRGGQAQSRVLCWADRESLLLTEFECSRVQQHLRNPSTSSHWE